MKLDLILFRHHQLTWYCYHILIGRCINVLSGVMMGATSTVFGSLGLDITPLHEPPTIFFLEQAAAGESGASTGMEEEEEEGQEDEEEQGGKEEEEEEEEEDGRDQEEEGQVGEGVLRSYVALLRNPKLLRVKMMCWVRYQI